MCGRRGSPCRWELVVWPSNNSNVYAPGTGLIGAAGRGMVVLGDGGGTIHTNINEFGGNDDDKEGQDDDGGDDDDGSRR